MDTITISAIWYGAFALASWPVMFGFAFGFFQNKYMYGAEKNYRHNVIFCSIWTLATALIWPLGWFMCYFLTERFVYGFKFLQLQNETLIDFYHAMFPIIVYFVGTAGMDIMYTSLAYEHWYGILCFPSVMLFSFTVFDAARWWEIEREEPMAMYRVMNRLNDFVNKKTK